MTVKTYLTDDVPDLTDDVLGRKVLYEDPKIPNSASASSATFTTAPRTATRTMAVPLERSTFRWLRSLVRGRCSSPSYR